MQTYSNDDVNGILWTTSSCKLCTYYIALRDDNVIISMSNLATLSINLNHHYMIYYDWLELHSHNSNFKYVYGSFLDNFTNIARFASPKKYPPKLYKGFPQSTIFHSCYPKDYFVIFLGLLSNCKWIPKVINCKQYLFS